MAAPTAAELRKFGLTVGTAFTLFGAISWWRGHELPPMVLATLAVLLVIPALVAPRVLGPVQHYWMAFATVLGHVNTRIILTVLYYLVITPIGFVMRFRRDPLNRSLTDAEGSVWIKRPADATNPRTYERQF